jgi:ferredoxin
MRISICIVKSKNVGRTEELIFHDPPPAPAETLLEWIETKSTAIAYGCRNGSCGTCMVEVLEGEDLLQEKTPQEADTLSRMGKSPQSRLACRARVKTEISGRITIKPQF